MVCDCILAATFSALPDVIPKPILEGNLSETALNPIVLVFLFYVITALVFTSLTKNKSLIKKMTKPTIIPLFILGLAESSGG